MELTSMLMLPFGVAINNLLGRNCLPQSDPFLLLGFFATNHGTVISQLHMISLSSGKEVYNEVIDCWAAVLNFEEKIRNPSSLRRFFCGTYPFNPSIRIIDNMHESQSIVGLRDDPDYMKKDTPYKEKYIFLMYLHLMGHPKAMEIKSSQIENLKISWAKTKNFVNCGIFVMRHMEMFYGQSYEGLGLWVSKRRKS
ncbi:hypothetical protein R6Q59_016470 [Mikania micrantha]